MHGCWQFEFRYELGPESRNLYAVVQHMNFFSIPDFLVDIGVSDFLCTLCVSASQLCLFLCSFLGGWWGMCDVSLELPRSCLCQCCA